MTDSFNNKIPYVPETTIDPAAGLNRSLFIIDVLMQCNVESVGNNAPVSPVEGERHIVGTAPTGEWENHANELAYYKNNQWVFQQAWMAVYQGTLMVFNGTAWVDVNGAPEIDLGEVADVTITTPTANQVLKFNGTEWVNGDSPATGTVTSVGMSAPTGFTVTGSPITGSGTINLSFDTGYSLFSQVDADKLSTAIQPTGSTIESVILKSFSETIVDVTDGIFDRANGGIQTVTLTANLTPTITMSDGQSMLMVVSGGDSWSITWPTGSRFRNGEIPDMSLSTDFHLIEITKINGFYFISDVGGYSIAA